MILLDPLAVAVLDVVVVLEVLVLEVVVVLDVEGLTALTGGAGGHSVLGPGTGMDIDGGKKGY